MDVNADVGPDRDVSTLVEVVSGPAIVAERPVYVRRSVGAAGQVSDGTAAKLRELERRCRHRERLLDRLGPGFGQANRGVRALFVGPSGTGKTLAAEVIAGSLGLDLLRVDLAAATRHGVMVANSPLFCIEEVSDHAAMLILAGARKLPHQLDAAARHGWNRSAAVAGMGDGDQHTPVDLPVVIAGSGCGQIAGGQHVKYPLNTPFMNLGLTMLAKVDVQVDKIGDSTGLLDL